MRSRRVLAILALVAGTLAGCLVLVEVVLRAYAGLAETSLAQALSIDPYDVLVEPHGEAGYRPRPGGTVPYWNGTEARINEIGYRGERVSIPKSEGTFRVLLLGGSTTFGWGVNDHETIAAQLPSELSRLVAGSRVEVVSLAFDGYDSWQLLERYRSDGARFEPDAVVVNTGINDVRNAWYQDIADGDRRTLLYLSTLDQLRYEMVRGGPTLWTRAKHWSYAMRVPGWLRGEMLRAGASAMPAQPEYHWDALDYFERNIERLVDSAVESGAFVLLSTAPSSLNTKYEPTDPPWTSYWIVDAQTTQMYRDSLTVRLRAVAERSAAAGKPVTYVTRDELPPSLFLDDAHLTPEGNRVMARILAEAIAPVVQGRATTSH